MDNRPQLPARARLSIPFYGDADGAVIPHAGRYARECVLLAFEMIGGVERLADWAHRNPTEFYTRLYSKVVTREVEVHEAEGIEELLARLDRKELERRNADPYITKDAEIISDGEE